MTEQLKGLQDLKNIFLYQMQLEINTSGGKGFVYDVAQVPDEWDVHTVIKYLKTAKIAFIDSSQGGDFNQFGPVDQSFSESVERLLNIVLFIDNQIDQVSGINEARQGISQGAEQAVGVTKALLGQSNLITEHRVKMFYDMNSKVFTQLARLTKVAWRDKEKFAAIVGDTGIDFLHHNVDVDLDDYAVFVETMPKAVDDDVEFDQYVGLAIQSRMIPFTEGLRLLRAKDKDYAFREFEKMMRKQEEAQAQEAERQRQHEMELENRKSQGRRADLTAQYQGQAQLANQTAVMNHTLAKELEAIKSYLKSREQREKSEQETNKELVKIKNAPKPTTGGDKK